MAKLTRDDVLHLAQLARIRLSDDEITRLQTELGSILGYVEQLNDVDVADLEPTTQVSGLTNVMREDEPVAYQAEPQRLLELAPDTDGDHVKVGRMVG